MSAEPDALGSRLLPLLSSAALARAFTLTVFATAFGGFAITAVAGAVTLATIVAGLCALGLAILVARRDEIELVRLAPTTLVLLVVWAGISAFWSAAPATALAGWAQLAGLAVLAVVIGHVRDALQTVRALGDVLRWLLGISLALEVLSGILLDLPIPFLGIQGAIAELGPVQGLFGTRNALGFVTVIALITFLVEFRTQSVGSGVAIGSVVLGGVLAALSGSPTVIVVALVTAAASLALWGVRRVSPARRRAVQVALGVGVVVAIGVASAARAPLIAALGAENDLETRTRVWTRVLDVADIRPVQGFGFFGAWDPDAIPFALVNLADGTLNASALNAYLDVLLQLGWVGLLLFLALGGLALARGWLVAGERRSVVHAWAPLTLVALLTVSLFESFTLTGPGWLLLALCAVRAGQSRSWRERLDLRTTDAARPAPTADGPASGE
ncbi:O-antigen ligase [Microbacterium hydrothermale]|uniref:O-antigen ligase family protein n=1 Tax=Microbacterium hydrothermale TaxID=857427 RepID=UPI002226EAC7|nr:O-antigen ligase family protein [Microbacterium hydrothermale]MCW2163838.1 O-antigen ligase [Microbacterium hydrothermale]